MQLNLSIMNPGYNELPDVTNIDHRMYTYLLYCSEHPDVVNTLM